MQSTSLPDASQFLVYEPRFMDPSSPDGLWLCTNAEDAATIQINAAALPVGATADNLNRARSFLEAFHFVLVVGPDESKRRALADALRRQVPSVEVCITANSVYHGCTSIRELQDQHGFSAIENLWQDAEELPPYGLLEISSVEKVDMAKIPHAKSGIPELDKLIGGLYEGEVSVWTGKRKEGKSTMIGLPILTAIREGRKVCVYSGELPAWRYKAWLLTMAAGPDNLTEEVTETGKSVWNVRPEVARQIDLWWKDKLFLLDNTAAGIHEPDKLLGLMQYTRKRFGCSVFVLDNLMTVSLPGEDKYNAQSAFVGQLVDFAHETSSHVHLVAHRRKGGTQKGSKGDSDDVSGSADITNRADNTFAVSRIQDDDSPFDAALEILANRSYGVTGIINLKFDIRSRRYYQGNLNWKCGWEKESAEQDQVRFTELTGDDADNPFT